MTTADKQHLHHRLLNLGHGHRRAVVILWAWTALLSGAVLFPALTNQGDALVPLAVIGLALALFTILHPGARAARDQANGEPAHDDLVDAATSGD